MDVTEDDFKQRVLDAPGLVLVDFWAPWCEPCKTMAKLLDRLDNVAIVKVNIDECHAVRMMCGVSMLPTLAFFLNGQEKTRLVGLQSLDTIHETICEVLPTSWDRIGDD